MSKVTREEAIEFMRGEVWSAQEWLDNFSDGKNKRGEMDIQQHRRKLRIRLWLLERLEDRKPVDTNTK